MTKYEKLKHLIGFLILAVFLFPLFLYCQTQWIHLQPRYDGETGMFVIDNIRESIQKETTMFIKIEYPFETKKEVFVEAKGELEVSVSETGENWKGPFAIQNKGFIPETNGKKVLHLKVYSKKGAQIQNLTADCGRSKSILEKLILPQTIETKQKTGTVEIVSGKESVVLHPVNFYYGISETRLSAGQMKTYSDVFETANTFVLYFLVENRSLLDINGVISVVLPEYANKNNTKVYFQYAGDFSGISQPPDTIAFNDEKPLVPDERGWVSPLYRKVKKGDVMTVTWNKLRSHKKQTTHFSSHLPVSFKGDVLWEYKRNDGTWGGLYESPWVSAKIPDDASRNPFQVRATCLDGEDKGTFSLQAIAFITKSELSEQDYFLPIDDADGRGSPLTGWSIAEIKDNVLYLNFHLKANPNPLLTANKTYSLLLNPGHQTKIKIEVKR